MEPLIIRKGIEMKAYKVKERQMSHRRFDWLAVMGLYETRRFFNLHGQSMWRVWHPWKD